jgi:hypothetical protein
LAGFDISFSMPESLDPGSVDRVVETMVRALGDMARGEWIRLAQKQLHTTKQAYIAGIGEMQFSGSGQSASASIELEGQLPNMVESGWPGGDLRDTVLGPTSKSRKLSKDGHWYAAVPFSHSTPGASGMTGAQMPTPVYALARQLKETVSGPDESVLWGDRLQKKEMQALGVKKAKPWHSTDLYTGMVRRSKQYVKAKQGSYGTFRMISTNPMTRKFAMGGRSGGGSEVGWIHPGIEAHHIINDVASFLEEQAGAVVAQSIGG